MPLVTLLRKDYDETLDSDKAAHEPVLVNT